MLLFGSQLMLPVLLCVVGASISPILQVRKLSIRVIKKANTTELQKSVHLTTAPHCNLTIILLLM